MGTRSALLIVGFFWGRREGGILERWTMLPKQQQVEGPLRYAATQSLQVRSRKNGSEIMPCL